MSLFVLNPKIEDRDEVEVETGQSTKRPITLSDINILFYFQADNKKKMVLECSVILVKSTKVYFLTENGHLVIFDFDICHQCIWVTRVIS
jgi:hypothetical protein